MSAHDTAPCPYCGRRTCVKDSQTWVDHLLPNVVKSTTEVASIGDRYCPMSGQRRIIRGHAEADYTRRAHQVADLAEQVRDRDPSVVWSVLTTIPADELQRLLMVALAGIDTEGKTLGQTFPWVARIGHSSIGRGLSSLMPTPAQWAVSA